MAAARRRMVLGHEGQPPPVAIARPLEEPAHQGADFGNFGANFGLMSPSPLKHAGRDGLTPMDTGFETSLFGEMHPIDGRGALVGQTVLPGEQQREQQRQRQRQQWQELKKRRTDTLWDPARIFGHRDSEPAPDDGASETVAPETAGHTGAAEPMDRRGAMVNQAIGWLWNNNYFSFVPMYKIMGEPELAKAILQRVPLPTLHQCCQVSNAFRGWAMAEIRTRPPVVLLGGLTTSWAVVDRPICLDFPLDGAMDWWQTEKCSKARIRCGAVGLSDRRVLMAGGLSCGGTQVERSAEVLDPNTMKWSPVSPMLHARLGCGCNTLNAAGTKAIFTGGVSEGPENADGLTSVEVFDAQTLQWEMLEPMNQARHGHVCTSFGADGGALVAGGKCGMELLSSVEVYLPATNYWTTVKRFPLPKLFSAAACLCSDGRCAVLGGWDGDKKLDRVYVYGELDESVAIAEAAGTAATAATANNRSTTSKSLGGLDSEPENWKRLAAMGSPAADFSVVSDSSFGTIVIRSSENTKEVVVEALRLPSVPIHEQQQSARAVPAKDPADVGEVSTVTTAGNTRGRATVACSTEAGSEEGRAALNTMRKLPHAQSLPVKLQFCVAACGVPSAAVPAPTSEEIAAQRARMHTKEK